MEVRPGYRKTEAGVLPEEWDVDSLASVTPRNVRNGIVDGPFGSNLKTIHYRKSGIPIITSGYVTEGRFVADSYLYVDKEKFEEEKRSAVQPGDIVVAKIGARCGASAILPRWHQTGILSGNTLKITVDESRHSTFYVWQVLWNLYSAGRVELLRTVGAQPAISMAMLKKYKLALPPLPEQRAIAVALSDADVLIGVLEKLIAKKRDLKHGAMQQLLTGKKRLPGFSGEWEVKRFGDAVSLRRDRVDPRKTSAHEFCVELEHIESASGRLLGSTSAGEQSSLKSVFRSGDVLFGKLRAYLRKCWLADRSGVCSTEIWVFVPNDCLIATDYLFQVIKTDEFIEVASNAYGTHMPRSDWNVVRNYEVRLPLLPEQTAIAAVLSDMDAEIAALEQRRDKTRLLKQGMMQELLTGRTRLV